MSNDHHTLGSVLLLVAGGATGYAAGRWIGEPWLASRTSRPSAKPMPTAMRRSLAAGPIDPYGEMKPVDPYAGPSGSMQPVDPYADAASSPVAAPSITLPAPKDGPITSPSQVDPSLVAPSRAQSQVAPPSAVVVAPAPPKVAVPSRSAVTLPPSASGKFATSAGVRRFDAAFDRYRGSIPLEYVRALVERESDGRPDVRTGSAVGLMQIVPVVLADYNKRHGTVYQSADLVEPLTNVAIGCELLRLIVDSYRKNHPQVPNLQTAWDNPRFVELLTFGWNAGFSEAGGVGRVVRFLEQLGGANDVTLDLVTAYAELAGASKHLSNPAKVAWCKSVVVLYQRERALVAARSTLATS